jgi:hypothetical protein
LEPNSIVIVSLHSPKEKLWGSLVSMNSSGVTLRGIDLNSFDDFIRQVLDPEGERIGSGFPRCFSRCNASSESRSTSPTDRFLRFPGGSNSAWGARYATISRYSFERNRNPKNVLSRLHGTESAHVPAAWIFAVIYYFHPLRQV